MRVRFASGAGGADVERVWEEIDDKSRARLEALLHYYADYNKPANPKVVHHIREHGLIQFRHHDYRIFTCIRRHSLVICGVIEKLNQKVSRATYERAAGVCNDDHGG